jgi:hypothetical protein
MSARSRRLVFCEFFFAAVLVSPLFALSVDAQEFTDTEVANLHECNLSKTNTNCKILIDRGNPVAPPTVQMYSGQRLAVVIRNSKFYERYFLDYTSGQATLSPDVASSIVQGLIPSLGKLSLLSEQSRGPFIAVADFQACTVDMIKDPNKVPAKGQVQANIAIFQDCLTQLSKGAIRLYGDLEPYVAPDSLTPHQKAGGPNLKIIRCDIQTFLNYESLLSGKITIIANNADLKGNQPDMPAIGQLGNLQKVVDAVAADLASYSQRITDVVGPPAADECKDRAKLAAEKEPAKAELSITSRKDDEQVYQKMATRTITYSLNTLNLISYSQQAAPDPTKKKLLATVAINFADKPTKGLAVPYTAFRWEASAGAFFSTLPVRSFSVLPSFTTDPKTGNPVVSGNTVQRNIIHPTVVPFAAGNYRLTNDLGWTRWKSNLYWTGAVGINPNTVTADFATGLSLSWRALMLSALAHFGHDVRLGPGFQVNQQLGAGFNGKLPTSTYWTTSFAIGVSVRVPSLTGR